MSSMPINRDLVFADDNIRLSGGSVKGLSKVFMGLGAVLVVIAFLVGLTDEKVAKIAIHALHTGFMVAIGLPVGAFAVVCFFRATNAGWASTIRRQFENIMAAMWVSVPLFLLVVIAQFVFTARFPAEELGKYAPFLWDWMNPQYTKGDVLFDEKQPFLSVWFFVIRQVLVFGSLVVLSKWMWSLSKQQDTDGNKFHTSTAGKLACAGLAVFAAALAFGSFDWGMALDYHWFSTMFPVYFFSGSVLSALCLATFILLCLKGVGKLQVAFTEEHLHDLSKLIFAFVVFWTYIAFSQYFLIWYANIPEETAFFNLRKTPGTFFDVLSWAIPVGAFIIPFLIMLPRPIRRSAGAAAFMCVWVFAFHVIELYWMIRGEAKYLNFHFVDLFAVLGPVLVMIGFVLKNVASGPLIPLKDPRERHALSHKNYV